MKVIQLKFGESLDTYDKEGRQDALGHCDSPNEGHGCPNSNRRKTMTFRQNWNPTKSIMHWSVTIYER
ncbi:hypothetical protein E2C01_032679 [Portunus trituberculatus]|uniref:Uncharacterized protein n=1 Tax=Portunus trituberculatus TaxID=210409 RepID=A0A5B7F087_PORTR|nr:hypothetical protein [Portunus trituberculatus]